MPISVPHTEELSWCSSQATKQFQQQKTTSDAMQILAPESN
jgi:hypothetical protein